MMKNKTDRKKNTPVEGKFKHFDTVMAEKLWFDGLIDREIAEKMGCAKCTVWNWRDKNGLPSNRNIFKWDRGESELRGAKA